MGQEIDYALLAFTSQTLYESHHDALLFYVFGTYLYSQGHAL